MLEHILPIFEKNKGKLQSQVVDGFHIIRRTFGKMRENWQSYVLTPISIILGKSDYHVYTHIQGVRIPQIPSAISEDIKEIVPWCETTCGTKYRERCLVRATRSEIDAIVIKDSNVCFIEHATRLEGLCWDMVKLFKLSSSQDSPDCLFLTWINLDNAKHQEYANMIINLGKRLFNGTIGEDNWAILFIPVSLKNEVLSVNNVEFFYKNNTL